MEGSGEAPGFGQAHHRQLGDQTVKRIHFYLCFSFSLSDSQTTHKQFKSWRQCHIIAVPQLLPTARKKPTSSTVLFKSPIELQSFCWRTFMCAVRGVSVVGIPNVGYKLKHKGSPTKLFH